MVFCTGQMVGIQNQQEMIDHVLLTLILLGVVFNGVMLWAIGQQFSDWLNKK